MAHEPGTLNVVTLRQQLGRHFSCGVTGSKKCTIRKTMSQMVALERLADKKGMLFKQGDTSNEDV